MVIFFVAIPSTIPLRPRENSGRPTERSGAASRHTCRKPASTAGGTPMASPVVHFEIRSADPDATREFYGKLFGWTYPEGGMPGYSYVDTGVEGAVPGGISPPPGGGDPLVTFFVGVQ